MLCLGAVGYARAMRCCIFFVFAFALSECAEAPEHTASGPACATDAECEDSRVCLLGRCRMELPLEDCASDFSCPAHQLCFQHQCVRKLECAVDDDCEANSYCSESLCTSLGVCDAGEECRAASVCEEGVCVRSAVDAGPADGGESADDDDDGFPLGEDADAGVGVDETPPIDLARGVYSYERLALGGLSDLVKVAFHPSGTYALVAQRSGAIHIVDASTLTSTRLTFPGAATVFVEDVAFSAAGDVALIVGQRVSGNTASAALFVFDDATAGLREVSVAAATAIAAAAFGWNGRFALLFRTEGGGSYSAVLRTFDPATDAFTALGTSPTSAGCTDIAIVKNEFAAPGIFITCGINGYDGAFYTEVGGQAEMRTGSALGSTNLGNTAHVAAHPSGDYALAVSWAGRSLRRFEGGQVNAAADAAPLSTRPIWSVAFAPDGGRALIVGGVANGVATVIEYRHDLYSCAGGLGASCDLTDVSVPGIAAPPFNAPEGFQLNDAAFRPGCDGGFLVGGLSNFNTDAGMVIRFQLENGVPCL